MPSNGEGRTRGLASSTLDLCPGRIGERRAEWARAHATPSGGPRRRPCVSRRVSRNSAVGWRGVRLSAWSCYLSSVMRPGLSWAMRSEVRGQRVTTFSGLSRNHSAGPVTYAQTPPAGGDHSAAWENCGIYRSPVPNENAVHSLEHGAVWITCRPDLPADQVTALQSLVCSQPYGLLSPYVGLPSPVVATI